MGSYETYHTYFFLLSLFSHKIPYLCKNNLFAMRRFLLWILLLVPMVTLGQNVEGSWHGSLELGGTKLRLVFHLMQEEGSWRATMDSPDQGARGIPVDSVAVTPLGVTLAIKPLQMTYTAGYLGESLVGMLTQSGQSFSLMLKRGEGERPRRPQEPQKPYPYHSEEVQFVSRDGATTLHGTLTRPTVEGRYPAVVLVTGSGTQNRDEELMEHKPFLLLADRLTRAGYAVLRYDDRGYKATPEELARLQGSTTDHLTLDALGAHDFLRRQPIIDGAKVGIAGHSEGGTIAFLAAAAEQEVAFVISLAGMTERGDRLLVEQNRALLMQSGVPEPIANDYATALERLYGAWQTRSPEAIVAEGERLAAEAAVGLQLPDPLRQNLVQICQQATNPWFYRFVQLDPAEAIRALGTRPCLAINGTKDLQVDAKINLGRLKELLGERPSLTIKAYEGLNHLMQPCTTGAVTEYAQIETTIDEQVLTDLVAWLRATIQ